MKLPRPNVLKRTYNTFANPNKSKQWIQISLQDAQYLHVMEWMIGHDIKFDGGSLYVLEDSEAFQMFQASAFFHHWKLSYNENHTRGADKIENFDCYYLGADPLC